MSDKNPTLSSISETLLLPLYNRAMESKRPDEVRRLAWVGPALARVRGRTS